MNLLQVSKKTNPLRVERHWIGGDKRDLEVYRIPLQNLYFNIENGRYADRMIRLRQENKGVEINPRDEKWKVKIEHMLAGEHRDTSRDKAAFDKLMEDIKARDQLRPGVVLSDGGVIDGNRRLAALRRLNSSTRNKFQCFDAVILPEDTGAEDRWRIEAGIQLGINERWDYSPINELLKIRQGIRMYEEMIEQGTLPASKSPIKLVAKAIYGKAEADIQEMAARLDLIDEYLEFIEQPEAYDRVGASSEDFLEASRIIRAAENHQLDPSFIGKLKAVLFYVIDREQMDNWELRKIYHALGGDPKKKGPKPKTVNTEALEDFLRDFPDSRSIRESLVEIRQPVATKPSASKTKTGSSTQKEKRTLSPSKPKLDTSKVEASTERFLRKMETTGRAKPLRKIAEGARADVQALEDGLAQAEVREALTLDERAAIIEALESMSRSLKNCQRHLKAS